MIITGSITLDKGIDKFLEKYVEEHRIERMKQGKESTKISIIRESLFLWAEQNGSLEDLIASLKQTK